MADVKISDLTDGGAVAAGDLVEIERPGSPAVSRKVDMGTRVAGALQAATEDQTITGGARVTQKDLGNLSGQTITLDPGDRPIQKITNNGAGTIQPGSNYGSFRLSIINASGAGAITTSTFIEKGDSFDTTSTSKFACSVDITPDYAVLYVTKVA